MANNEDDIQSLLSSISDSYAEENIAQETVPETPQVPVPQYTDKDLEKLIDFIKRKTTLFALDHNDWSENVTDNIIKQWLLDVNELMLTIFYSGNKLKAALTFPQETVHDLAYFLREPNQIFTVDGFHDEITYGTIHEPIDGTLLTVLERVYAPIFFQYEEWSENIKSYLCSSLHNFLSFITGLHYKMSGMTVLYIPPNTPNLKLKEAVKDRELIRQLEAVAVHWTSAIRTCLSDKQQLVPYELITPIDEFKFWINRYEVLQGLYTQLTHEDIKHIIHILKMAQSVYIKQIADLIEQCHQEMKEAKENIKYLQVVVEPCSAIDKCENPTKIPVKLPKIIHVFRFIWLNSSFYNTREYLTGLFRTLSNQIIKNCRRHINIEKIFDGNPRFGIKMCDMSIDCCLSYKRMYEIMSKQHRDRNSEIGWDLDNATIFNHINAFIERCYDLIDVCESMIVFGRIDETEAYQKRLFSGSRGKEFEAICEDVRQKFISGLDNMKTNLKKIILDVHNNEWYDGVVVYRELISGLEGILRHLLSEVFVTINNLEDGLEALSMLYFVSYRQSIRHFFLMKVTQVWEMFGVDIIHTNQWIAKESEEHLSWIPKYASRAIMYKINLERIERLKALLTDAKWLPEVPQSIAILSEYDKLQKKIKSAIKKAFHDWIDSLGLNFASKLNRSLMVRSKTHPELLECNIDQSILTMCEEAKHFENLGFQMPANVNQIYSKAENIRSTYNNVVTVALDYNKIITALSVDERKLFNTLITLCNNIILDGLTKLKWGGDYTEDYIKNCAKHTSKLQEFLERYKMTNQSIAEICEKICDLSVLKLDNSTTITLDKIVKNMEEHRQSTILELLQMYKNIVELLSYVKENGFDKLKKHEWDEYILRFDKMIETAILTNAKNSLYHIYEVLHGVHDIGASPFILLELDIQEGNISLDPSFNKITMLFSNMLSTIIDSFKRFPRLWEYFKLYEEKYTKSFSEVMDSNKFLKIQHSINREIRISEEKLMSYLKRWAAYKYLWELDKSVYIENYGKMKRTAENYSNDIQKYTEKGNEIMMMDTITDVHCLVVNSSKLKNSIIQHIEDWQSRYVALLKENATQEIIDIYKYMEVNSENIMKIPRSIPEMKKASSLYDRLIAEVDSKYESFKNTYQMFKVLKEYDGNVSPNTQKMVTYLEEEWQAYLATLREASEMIGVTKDDFKFDLLSKAEKLKIQSKNLLEDFNLNAPTSSKIPTNQAFQIIQNYRSLLQNLYSTESEIIKDLSTFNINQPDNLNLRKLEEEINTLEEIWKLIAEWESSWENYKVGNFWAINLIEMEDYANTLYKQLSHLCRVHIERNWEMLESTRKQVDAFRKTLPLITALKNQALRTRHWDKVRDLIGQDFDQNSEEFTMEAIIGMNLQAFEEDILEISNAATMELQIENGLNNISETWQNTALDMVYFKDGVYRIKSVDDCFETLEENLTQISSMKSTRYIEPFAKEVDYWEKTLSYIMETLEQALTIQRQWLYLENIFAGEDIQKQLPTENAKFSILTNEWKNITATMHSAGTVMNATHIKPPPWLFDKLTEMDSHFELIQRALEVYLETKRQLFPRFYFISNDDLLEILGNANKPDQIQVHLKKLFDNLHKLELKRIPVKKPKWEALGMYSDDGEYVEFFKTVIIDGPSEMWLNLIEKAMVTCLKEKLKKTKFSLKKNLNNRDKWISLWPGQLCLTSSLIQWTKSCTNALLHCKMTDERKPLRKLRKKQNQVLNKLSEMSRKDLSKQLRLKVNTLITIEIHGRDVIERMYKLNCKDINHFEWFSQLRFYWDHDNDVCFIEQTNTKHYYSYEYTGNSGRLVITPLTDRCYITLTTALHLHRGGSPKGPAGTGKTETVKDLGKALGIWVIVTNCSEGLDYKSIGKNFSGLAQTGTWGCFDEFNRINIEVLSVVAQQILSILSALSAKHQKFNFEGQIINLKPTVGIFITMNPGYAGRTELPDNLKSMFRPIAMIVPDNVIIAENLLFSDGFQNTKSLARKVFTLYELAKRQLSKQYHYDFGLRSMVALLRYAGRKRRQLPKSSEEQIIYLAMKDMNMARLTANDLPLFHGIMSDIFPEVIVPNIDYHDFAKAIEDEFITNQHQVIPIAITKVIELHETKSSRHSVMIIGDTGTAKSTTWKTLQGAYGRMKTKNFEDYVDVSVYPINPKALTLAELYGEYNLSTGEWLDGVLSSIMRTICADESPSQKWMLFDGPVDAVWIENMNSVMDDNKVLTLVNSERITMPSQVSLLFEVADLAMASPATVSRCGMVYNDYNDWGWRPYVNSWLSKQKPKKYVILLQEYFDRYLDRVLEFKRKNCEETVPVNELNLIMSMCQFLSCLATKENGIVLDNEETLESMTKLWFLFCMVWSVCATVDEIGRLKIDALIREIDNAFPVKDTIYDYYVEPENRCFIPWENKLPENWKYDKNTPFYKIIVPTIDTIRYEYLVSRLLSANIPVLLVGKIGTGKSSTAINVTENFNTEKYSILSINLSAQTTASGLQDSIESKTEKRTKNIFVPFGGKSMIVFLDDFNMPAKDTYGSQPSLELIRQWIDYHFWYNRKTQQRTYVKQTLILAAMGPPGGGRQFISSRILSKFSVINMTFPTNETIVQIFGTMIKQHLHDFPKEVKQMWRKITELTTDIFNDVSIKMLPTPAKSHYLFNLRDISKVFQGLLRSNAEYHSTRPVFLRLWIHEVFRVFCDRLVNHTDIEWMQNKTNELLGRHFDATLANLCPNKKIPIFGDFTSVKGHYEDLQNIEDLRYYFEQQLQELNNSPGVARMDLVFFNEAIQHICRLVRVISQPRGHMLNIGIGGYGRRSLAKMAAFICEFHVFQIEISKKYKTPEFREDLKTLYKMCGVKNREVVFLFADEQIAETTFLEIINNMLSTGESSLFKTDEFDEIKSEMEPFAKRAGISPTTEAMYGFFMERVRNNLHIVLCFSPISTSFRLYLRQYPALVNSTTINWFQDWTEDALLEVAQKFLLNSKLNMKADTLENSKENSILNIEKTLQQATAIIFSKIHMSVAKMSKTMLLELKRHNYVTPINYLCLVTGFQKMLNEKRTEIFSQSNKLRKGLSKIEETAGKVAGMSEELKVSQDKVAELTAQCNEFLVVIKIQTKEADEQKKIVAAESAAIAQKEIECKSLANQAQSELSEVMPAFEAAIRALDALNKKDISEVKSYGRPPVKVERVMEAVLILLGKEPTWEMAKRVLADQNFLSNLRDFDKDHIPDKVLKKIAVYTRDRELEPEKVGAVSLACKSLMLWIIAIENYGRVYRVVAPKKAKLDEALESLHQNQRMLEISQKNLAELNSRLEKLQTEFLERSKMQEELKQKADNLKLQLERAIILVESLSGERLRWIETVKTLDTKFNYLPGDCIIATAFLSYLGPFNTKYREELLQYWLPMVKEFEVPCSEELNIKDFLCTPTLIRDWTIQGLPSDDFSTENGIIVTKAERWPLIIDPQAQAINWIKNLEKRNLIIIDFAMTDHLKKLEGALKNGNSVLLQNVGEIIESSINPILSRTFIIQDGKKLINFNEKFILYNDSFKFYITTKLSNPHYSPEFLSKTTLVNFAVKVSGLQAQLLGIIVRKEKPALEEQKDNLVITIANSKKTLIDLDNEILRLLNESRGSLLEDEELFLTLQLSRKTSVTVKESLSVAEVTEIEIDVARQAYQPAAERAAILFFVLIDMSKIDPMYQFSLKSYTMLFVKSIEKSTKNMILKKRIENINKHHTYAVYKNTCRGLFEKHKLLFSCHMCAKIHEISGKLNLDEYNFLLKGGVVLDRKTQTPNPAPDWITEQAWDNITILDKMLGFHGIAESFNHNTRDWREWYWTTTPETNPLVGEWNSVLNGFQKMLVIRCLRTDRMSACISSFITHVLGSQFVEPPVLDLKTVLSESISKTPLIFVLSPGVDPTANLIALAEQKNMGDKLHSVSLGQGQAPLATKLLKIGVKEGHWIFLANCHLSLSWMSELDKIIDTIQTENINKHFRLWLSSSPHPEFPISILQSGIKMTTEPPRGIKANLKRLFNTISEDQFERCKDLSKYKKLLFSLCFFHAILLERRKFQQLGWNVVYSFNDSDFEVSENLLVLYLDEYEETPWSALKYLISEVNYGGHVTDDFDRRLLRTYINQFFNDSALNTPQFRLSSLHTYYIPRDGHFQYYIDYIQRLPNFDPPEAFGQHPNADITSLMTETRMMFETLVSLQVQKLSIEGETKEDKVLRLIGDIASKLPEQIDYENTSKLMGLDKSPLDVVLLQEIERYNFLLNDIQNDLDNLKKGIKGEVVMSSDLDDMFNSIYEGRVPANWLKAYPSLKPLASWARELILRVEHFNNWARTMRQPSIFWLSAFTYPAGFLTAVMQTAARALRVPIDELSWEFKVFKEDDAMVAHQTPDSGVFIRGLFLEGAGWNRLEQCLKEPQPMELVTVMPSIHFKPVENTKKRTEQLYSCPCYYYPIRAGSFVIAIDLNTGTENSDFWTKRGTALLLNLAT